MMDSAVVESSFELLPMENRAPYLSRGCAFANHDAVASCASSHEVVILVYLDLRKYKFRSDEYDEIILGLWDVQQNLGTPNALILRAKNQKFRGDLCNTLMAAPQAAHRPGISPAGSTAS